MFAPTFLHFGVQVQCWYEETEDGNFVDMNFNVPMGRLGPKELSYNHGAINTATTLALLPPLFNTALFFENNERYLIVYIASG